MLKRYIFCGCWDGAIDSIKLWYGEKESTASGGPSLAREMNKKKPESDQNFPFFYLLITHRMKWNVGKNNSSVRELNDWKWSEDFGRQRAHIGAHTMWTYFSAKNGNWMMMNRLCCSHWLIGNELCCIRCALMRTLQTANRCNCMSTAR